MTAPTAESYARFLERLAKEASLLETAGEALEAGEAGSGLTFESWSLALSERTWPNATLRDAWQAGATAMFQALVERGYLAPHEAERAMAATNDVLA
jgi:hypothetical protein